MSVTYHRSGVILTIYLEQHAAPDCLSGFYVACDIVLFFHLHCSLLVSRFFECLKVFSPECTGYALLLRPLFISANLSSIVVSCISLFSLFVAVRSFSLRTIPNIINCSVSLHDTVNLACIPLMRVAVLNTRE